MRKDDAIRLRHMLDAALEARSFISGRSRADLGQDRMLTLSLVKCIGREGGGRPRSQTSSNGIFSFRATSMSLSS